MVFWRRRNPDILAFDFGSKITKVMFKGKLLFAEPTLIAKKLQTDEVLKIGYQASKFGLNKQMEIINPISNGRINNQQATIDLVDFLAKSLKIQGLPLPKTTVWASLLNAGLTQVEKDRFEETWQLCGGKKHNLISQESVLATYAFKKHHVANINLVDIGHSSTRIIMLEDKKAIHTQVLPWGMICFEEAVEKFLVSKNILASVGGVQKIVEEVASLNPEAKKQLVLSVKMGLNQDSRNLRINSKQLLQTATQAVAFLGALIEDFITLLPLPLQDAIKRNGLLLVGGGANLEHLDSYLATNLKIFVKKGDDATYANVLGLEELLGAKLG